MTLPSSLRGQNAHAGQCWYRYGWAWTTGKPFGGLTRMMVKCTGIQSENPCLVRFRAAERLRTSRTTWWSPTPTAGPTPPASSWPPPRRLSQLGRDARPVLYPLAGAPLDPRLEAHGVVGRQPGLHQQPHLGHSLGRQLGGPPRELVHDGRARRQGPRPRQPEGPRPLGKVAGPRDVHGLVYSPSHREAPRGRELAADAHPRRHGPLLDRPRDGPVGGGGRHGLGGLDGAPRGDPRGVVELRGAHEEELRRHHQCVQKAQRRRRAVGRE
mmetsp:Transcript_4910/g.11444  ORF Transcript_4910/g.11444 Transcript_4910/m.11444 type:complete len:269 (+) Transcript_4910:1080-1886(+)